MTVLAPKVHAFWNAAMQGLVLLVLVGFAVTGAALVYIGYAESTAPYWSFGLDLDRGHLAFWTVTSGGVALALAIGALRLRLYRSLACVLALGFFVYVVGFTMLVTLKTARPGSEALVHFVLPFVLLIGGAIVWCLLAARSELLARGRRAGIGSAAVLSAGLVLAAIGLAAGGVPGVEPPEKPTLRAASATEVTQIIAVELSVPITKVVPDARLVEDLNAEGLAINEILADLTERFGTEEQVGDDDLLITVQDVLDYAQSPNSFRETHTEKRRERP